MQELLANYLFQYKQAVLPQIGTLHLRTESATSIFGEQKIAAPVSYIVLLDEMGDSVSFIEYIAANKHISIDEAAYQLNKFSEEITSLHTNNSFEIERLGKFSKDENEKIIFEGFKPPAYFLPSVHAERVIHPNESHTMLVGDTETSTAAMVDFYTEEAPVKKSKWWVWALVLFAVAIAGIAFYLNRDGSNPYFGNSNKEELKAADSTYKMLP